MKLTITGRKFTVTDRLTERITEKLAKFDKYFDDEATSTVVLRSRKNAEIIEITIYSKGTMFRAEVEDETALNALDRAVDIIERQMDAEYREQRIIKKLFAAETVKRFLPSFLTQKQSRENSRLCFSFIRLFGFGFDQAIFVVLFLIDNAGLVVFNVGEKEEFVVKQIHLEHSLFRRHRLHNKLLGFGYANVLFFNVCPLAVGQNRFVKCADFHAPRKA